jgi:hypothetical protein
MQNVIHISRLNTVNASENASVSIIKKFIVVFYVCQYELLEPSFGLHK